MSNLPASINTRNIKFVKDDDSMEYNPTKELNSFYQFCQFKNPKTNKFETRKIIFNERGKIIKTFDKEYSGEEIEKYIANHNFNKYKMYSTNKIQYVAKPNESDFLATMSSLLNSGVKNQNEF